MEIFTPFSDEKFHFLKATGFEDLVEIQHQNNTRSVIKVNISPVFESHSVWIPHIDNKIPQFIEGEYLLKEMRELKIKNYEKYLIGYNSAGAFSTINHLHFQILNLEKIGSNTYC